MKNQLLIILMITIMLATVFVTGCTGSVTNTTSPSPVASTATRTPTASPTLTPQTMAMPPASVVASPVSKQTTNVHSNYAVDAPVKRQTYLDAYLDAEGWTGDVTRTIGVGQYTSLSGVLALSPPALNPDGYGVPRASINIQYMNSDGKTWTTFGRAYTRSVFGSFEYPLQPKVAGVYTFRAIYYGDSRYAPAVSNVATLTVTNVEIS